MELVDDFAFPLPITVIAELLGIPMEDQQRFREWSSAVVTPAFSPEEQELARRRGEEFVVYLDDLFERRRDEPTDDLVSALVEAEEAGDHLSEDELRSMIVLLIVAGHETTVSLITNAVLALLSNPDQLAALRSDRSLMSTAVEELLRYDSPVERAITRLVAVDGELGGEKLHRGDLVVAVIGSANRDESRFACPDALELGREENKHVGFGRGPHYCLGAPLARLETELALTTLLDRLPNLRLAIADEDLYWRPIPIFRSLTSLPVAWDV
jgi:cytochrome P450